MNKIRNLIERWRNNRQMHRYVQARRYAEHDVQLCEFNGATYISVNGVPVINIAWLKPDLYVVIDNAREVSSDYLSKRR